MVTRQCTSTSTSNWCPCLNWNHWFCCSCGKCQNKSFCVDLTSKLRQRSSRTAHVLTCMFCLFGCTVGQDQIFWHENHSQNFHSLLLMSVWPLWCFVLTEMDVALQNGSWDSNRCGLWGWIVGYLSRLFLQGILKRSLCEPGSSPHMCSHRQWERT